MTSDQEALLRTFLDLLGKLDRSKTKVIGPQRAGRRRSGRRRQRRNPEEKSSVIPQ